MCLQVRIASPRSAHYAVAGDSAYHLWTEEKSYVFRKVIINHAELLVELGDFI